MEVLVAISVMGIVYATLFGLMTTSLKNIRRIDEREKVVRYSQMKLNELVLRNLWAHEEDLPLSGRFDESYSWKAEVLPLESDEERDSAHPFRLALIRLTALRQNPAGEQVYSLETIARAVKPQ
jgi:type II secretory pathway pseudopilin PulG